MPHQPESLPAPPERQIGIGDCDISDRAKALVREVLDSNRLSAGPMMARFESEVAALHGCAYGLMSNSGTSALHIALAALKERNGWEDGDEVLVPAVTFVATANIVLFNGLTPVFCDVEPDYFCLDPAGIEARITQRTRAIIPVHVAGSPCDMDPILEIAAQHELRIVEDSAEAMAVHYKGRPVGSFGDVGCFSTYVAHVISTGVGGLCTTNDLELLAVMKSLMNHGRDAVYTRIDDDADVTRALELDDPGAAFLLRPPRPQLPLYGVGSSTRRCSARRARAALPPPGRGRPAAHGGPERPRAIPAATAAPAGSGARLHVLPGRRPRCLQVT